MTRLDIPFDNPMTYPGHSGVDFPQAEGTPFLASGSGVVEWLGRNDRGGYFIWVRYDSIAQRVGYHHMPSHAHCPGPGVRFAYGDKLGVVGNTGNSTGPHLHSEVEGYGTTEGYWKFFNPNSVVSKPKKLESESDMIMLKVVAGKGVHLCALGEGIFKHFVVGEPYEKIMRVSRERDDWQTIDISELPAFLATYGCDRNIWDFRDDSGKSVSYIDPKGKFVVLDPLSGTVKSGNVWTATGAIRASITR